MTLASPARGYHEKSGGVKLKAKKSPFTLFWLEPRLETFYVKFKIVLIFIQDLNESSLNGNQW
jgi:hypothetical protein